MRRRLLDTHGETPQALRDLSISLGKLGDLRLETGDEESLGRGLWTGETPQALPYQESLALDRRLVDAYGETPQALRDLSVSLDRLGDVQRETGEVAAATAAYEESLALRRRLVDAYGETPQALRDLSISLNRLGDVRRETGDVAAATAKRL